MGAERPAQPGSAATSPDRDTPTSPWKAAGIQRQQKDRRMAQNIERLAERLGARIVCLLPDVGGGALGMARLAGLIAALQARLPPSQRLRPGRPTEVGRQHLVEETSS